MCLIVTYYNYISKRFLFIGNSGHEEQPGALLQHYDNAVEKDKEVEEEVGKRAGFSSH